MYDAKLVRAAQEGDEAAFSAIYDRSVDAVHDLCWSLIGDAEEAGRIVEDTFVLAARHLRELSDASQVRAWLLAIARDRILTEDEQGTLRPGWGTDPPGAVETGAPADPTEPLGTVSLRNWAARAAAVLALTDQAVLELQLRHQLEGDQLAAAIGCSEEQLRSVTERVDAEARHVIGALVVARQARRDCPELDAALGGWDGTPTADIADLVDSHAAGCERCSRRRSLVEPLELVAAAPVVGAPANLRNQVLDLTAVELADHRTAGPVQGVGVLGAAGVSAASSDPDSGAVAVATEIPRRRVTPVFALAAAVIVLAGALVLVLHNPSRQQTAAAVRPGNLSVAPGPTTSDSPATTAVASLVPLDTSTSTSTSTSVAPTGRLELNASKVDFGGDATSAQITLRNSGAGSVDWVASSSASWLAVSPAAGHLDSTGAASILLTLDRKVAPPGPFDVTIGFQPADHSQVATSVIAVGSATGPTTTTSSTSTTTSTTLASGPTITGLAASPSTVYSAPCNPNTSTVSVTVNDPATVTSVTMSYVLADGRKGTTALSPTGSNQWSGPLGPSSTSGTTTFRVTATDSTGASRSSDPGTVNVLPCH